MSAPKQPIYDIDTILDETLISDKPHYLVKWKGFSATESTWEPIDNLLGVLDVLHDFKTSRNPHSRYLVEQQEAEEKKKKKTKKIGVKGHSIKSEELQQRLNASRKDSLKRKKLRKAKDPENFTLISSDEEVIDETNTHENQDNFRNQKSRGKAEKREKSRDKEEKMQGFKVVGKITREGLNRVVECFEWEGQKVCEVELKDGRRVNMRREDVRKICPDKLCDYYELTGRS